MIDLMEIIQSDFKFLLSPVPDLKVGKYIVKNYYLTQDDKFVKVLYLDTDLGFYQTKSRTMIGLMYGIVGNIFDSAIDQGETIKVEVVNKRSVRGYMSLSFRLV